MKIGEFRGNDYNWSVGKTYPSHHSTAFDYELGMQSYITFAQNKFLPNLMPL